MLAINNNKKKNVILCLSQLLPPKSSLPEPRHGNVLRKRLMNILDLSFLLSSVGDLWLCVYMCWLACIKMDKCAWSNRANRTSKVRDFIGMYNAQEIYFQFSEPFSCFILYKYKVSSSVLCKEHGSECTTFMFFDSSMNKRTWPSRKQVWCM